MNYQHIIKIFQRKDGNLIFLVSTRSGIPRDMMDYVQECLKKMMGKDDRAIIAPDSDFQFFNISDEQLKQIQIPAEKPIEPKLP
jgi:hypothetical protein